MRTQNVVISRHRRERNLKEEGQIHQEQKMRSAEEKVKNMASSAKEHIDIAKAKSEEKAEKAMARTHDEKVMAEERRKVREAEAKMELHQDKARHAAEKHEVGHLLPGDRPVAGAVDPVMGTTVPSYPIGDHPPGHHHHKHT